MTLTEQWKKGELPDGLYYCKLNYSKNISIERCKSHCIAMAVGRDELGEEVLAKVPSYEEFKQLEHENTLLKVANAELRSRLDGIVTQLEQAFYDDKVSFWDILVKIKKGLDK